MQYSTDDLAHKALQLLAVPGGTETAVTFPEKVLSAIFK